MVKSQASVMKKLKKYINLLTENYKISAVVLYGSYANGTQNEYSDIDIAVFSEEFGTKPYEEAKLLFKLRRKIDTDIEPLPFSSQRLNTKDKTDFCYGIINRGKLLYKKGKFLI